MSIRTTAVCHKQAILRKDEDFVAIQIKIPSFNLDRYYGYDITIHNINFVSRNKTTNKLYNTNAMLDIYSTSRLLLTNKQILLTKKRTLDLIYQIKVIRGQIRLTYDELVTTRLERNERFFMEEIWNKEFNYTLIQSNDFNESSNKYR
jgi:hypothetical protein